MWYFHLRESYPSFQCHWDDVISHVTVDFNPRYYQFSFLSFTSISQVFQCILSWQARVRPQPNNAQRKCASIPMILSCAPLSYRACVCALIDVCVQLLLFMFRGQHKIIPQHSRRKSFTKPLDLANQNSDSSGLVLTSSYPINHGEIHTLWGLHNVMLPPPTSPLHYPTSSVKNGSFLLNTGFWHSAIG